MALITDLGVREGQLFGLYCPSRNKMIRDFRAENHWNPKVKQVLIYFTFTDEGARLFDEEDLLRYKRNFFPELDPEFEHTAWSEIELDELMIVPFMEKKGYAFIDAMRFKDYNGE